MSPATLSAKSVRNLLGAICLCAVLLSLGLWGTTATADRSYLKPFGPKATVSGSKLNEAPAFLNAITVNSTAQSPGATGDCTLGEAIQAANTDTAVDGCSAGSGQDTIILPAGTYTLSTVADTFIVGATGLPAIKSNVIIQGAGRTTTIIERDPNAVAPFRLMGITYENAGSLVLNDVTMRGGRGENDGDTGTRGGALFSYDRPVILNNVDFIDNTAPLSGGALDSGGFVTANNCTFTNNHSEQNGGGGGGGAISAGGITISHSTFTGNTASTSGGGAILSPGRGAHVNISDSTFVNNSTLAEGGALESSGTITIARSTFDGNSSVGPAGALSLSGNVNISYSVVINNHATYDIGGISNYTVSGGANVLNIDHCNISNNTSDRFGGGILIQGTTASVSNSTISGNTAGRAGGVWIDSAFLTLTNVTVAGNQAVATGGVGQGGGMWCQGVGAATLNNVTITGNQATSGGGGLFHHSGAVNLKNSIIALNASDDIHQFTTPLTSLGYNLWQMPEH